jgi:hypothetical protein
MCLSLSASAAEEEEEDDNDECDDGNDYSDDYTLREMALNI